jgi:hypothetical protein
MSRSLRSSAALALVGLISLVSGSCGSNAPAKTSTSTGEGNTTATTTARDKAVKFAECIREHDVPHFPDPNAEGEFVFGIDVSPEVWGAAVDACKALQPPGSLSAQRTPEQQSAGLEFAQCIRDNGVNDFPDPANGEPLIDTTRIPSTDRKGGMSALNAAMEKCRDFLDAAAKGQ